MWKFKKIRLIAVCVFAFLVGLAGVLGLDTCIRKQAKESVEEYKKEQEENSMYTEKGVTKELKKRGFELPIMTSSEDNLDVYIPSTVEDDSDKKHLLYFTNYLSTNHEEWVIYVLGKDIFASPVSFDTEDGEDYVVIESGSSSEKLPNSGTSSKIVSKLDTNHENYIFIEVEKVDAKTLDGLDYQTLKECRKK